LRGKTDRLVTGETTQAERKRDKRNTFNFKGRQSDKAKTTIVGLKQASKNTITTRERERRILK